ncbi:MAG TPA: hypothetical protein VGE08_01210 [Steroidobacter sp.]|uniref:hypothetical protein n=1 Tax=Steroidobacter sp. TaxID=1978227 RepID=UPI002ED7D151
MDAWVQAMRCGDFPTAWRISDGVLKQRLRKGELCDSWPRHLQFIWRGEPLAGRRLFVRCYHGLGDTLQFVRLLATPRLRAAEITLWAQPQLLTLLRTVRGIDHLLPLHEGEPDVDYDVDVELMELPHALRIDSSDLPGPLPYIYVSAPPCSSLRTRRIGICWRSGDWRTQRSIPVETLRPLASLPDIRWFNLQFPSEPCELPAAPIACRDLAEMAVRLRLLNLVITVDTMTAHLAGALGLPVWLLLDHDPDWRWMSGRDDSPWYPTMRLFRQRRPGDWAGVIEEVRSELGSGATPVRGIGSSGYRAFSG